MTRQEAKIIIKWIDTRMKDRQTGHMKKNEDTVVEDNDEVYLKVIDRQTGHMKERNEDTEVEDNDEVDLRVTDRQTGHM